MTAHPWAGIEYKNPVSIDIACSDSHGISDLLSLLMGASTISHEPELQSPEAVDRVGDRDLRAAMRLLGARLPVKETPKSWMPHEVLFAFPSIRGQFEEIVKAWFRLRKEHRYIITAYFACRRHPAAFVNGQFFDIARTAEALHRGLGPGNEQKSFSENEADEIRTRVGKIDLGCRKDLVLSRLNTINQPSFRERLLKLLQRFPVIADDTIGDEKSQGSFARRVKDLRNMEAHLSGTEKDDNVDGVEYVRIESKLRVIIDAWLLSAVGLTDDQIIQAMRGNNRYWFYASNQTWPWNA